MRVRVIGVAPVTENMPGGAAIKPGDVLTIRNGKTIEVLNTDAEGRLVLADGLSLAAEMPPDAIVDLATLTGAASSPSGAASPASSAPTTTSTSGCRRPRRGPGEPVWPLPMPEEYRTHIDSDVADMKNIGGAGQAGAIVAGLFLPRFTGGVPWAHLDIAGTGPVGGDGRLPGPESRRSASEPSWPCSTTMGWLRFDTKWLYIPSH